MSEPSREACFGGVVNKTRMDCGWMYVNSLLVRYVCLWGGWERCDEGMNRCVRAQMWMVELSPKAGETESTWSTACWAIASPLGQI